MKVQQVTQIQVTGKGDSAQKAFADALSRVQSQVLQSTQQVLLSIEPLDVEVVKAIERCKTEKFLFFFLPKKRSHFSITLNISVSITAIDTAQVEFELV